MVIETLIFYEIQCSYKNTEIHTTYIVSKIVQKVIFEEEKRIIAYLVYQNV